MECHDCRQVELEPIKHIENCTYSWFRGIPQAGYQVYQCPKCGGLWRCHYQLSDGTGDSEQWRKMLKEGQ